MCKKMNTCSVTDMWIVRRTWSPSVRMWHQWWKAIGFILSWFTQCVSVPCRTLFMYSSLSVAWLTQGVLGSRQRLRRIGMAMGRSRVEGWDLRPRLAWIFLAPSPPRPAPHDEENFLPYPRPLRPREDSRSPALHRKTLFLVNFPYNYYHFFK